LPIGVGNHGVEPRTRHVRAEGPSDFEQAIDGMFGTLRRRDEMGVKPRASFPRRRQSHPNTRPRRGGQETGAEEALQVDREVESARAQLSNDIADATQTAWVETNCAPVERNHLIQMWISVDQSAQPFVDEPRESCRRPMVPQRREGRQGVDDVSQRAGFDDQHAIGLNRAQFGRISWHGPWTSISKRFGRRVS